MWVIDEIHEKAETALSRHAYTSRDLASRRVSSDDPTTANQVATPDASALRVRPCDRKLAQVPVIDVLDPISGDGSGDCVGGVTVPSLSLTLPTSTFPSSTERFLTVPGGSISSGGMSTGSGRLLKMSPPIDRWHITPLVFYNW